MKKNQNKLIIELLLLRIISFEMSLILIFISTIFDLILFSNE
jgi:hypothetical protein